MSGNIVDVNSDNWDAEVAQSELPVLLDFWAPWCGPCKALMPTLEWLAGNYAGRVKFAKINCDDNKPLVERFGVRGIPHLQVMRGGELVSVLAPAALTRTRLAMEIDGLLA